MTIKKIGILSVNEKKIKGLSVDIFSIMISDKYDPNAIPNIWQKFWSELPKNANPSDSRAYGVSFPIESEPGKLHYVAGIEATSENELDEKFETYLIPSGRYLHLEHSGAISDLANSYSEAYGEIFPNSGFEMRQAPHLELYDTLLNPTDPDYCMGILIPII